MSNINETTNTTFGKDVLESKVPVLVDFFADWCGPCKALSPKLEEVAGALGEKTKFVKIDVDNAQDIATQFGVRGIPTLVLFRDGKEIDRLVGNQPKDAIVSLFEKHGI